jgi:hypothetical protein
MEYLHSRSAINNSDVDEKAVDENNELSITPVNNADTIISSKSQVI